MLLNLSVEFSSVLVVHLVDEYFELVEQRLELVSALCVQARDREVDSRPSRPHEILDLFLPLVLPCDVAFILVQHFHDRVE